jgi:hypothetical protein
VEGPAVSFCPSDLAAPNKSHRPQLCHPERTRISYFTALPAATFAALRKESRMKSTEATVFDRKSGGAEGPAVRPGSRAKVPVPLVLPQNRHPELVERGRLKIAQEARPWYCASPGLLVRGSGFSNPRECSTT